MYSSLRAFRDLQAIEQYKQGLERIIQASAEIFSARSVNQLSQGILEQLVALLTRSKVAAYYKLPLDGFTASGDSTEQLQIIAATGQYCSRVGEQLKQPEVREILETLRQRKDQVAYQIHNNTYYGLYQTSHGAFYMLFIEGVGELSETDQHLLTLFMNNTAIAFEHTALLQVDK